MKIFGKRMLPPIVTSNILHVISFRTMKSVPAKSPPPPTIEAPMEAANSPLILYRADPQIPPVTIVNPTGQVWKFIPPLALTNDALQWVQNFSMKQPIRGDGMASSIPAPPLFAAFFRPLEIDQLNATELNQSEALGTIGIQAMTLDEEAENFG